MIHSFHRLSVQPIRSFGGIPVCNGFRLHTTTRSQDEVFMKLALRHAQAAIREKEIPIGAVLVDETNTVIATAGNRVENALDASAHAEVECLRKAAKLIGNWRLSNCTLYTTVEPCAMCLSAIQAFRLKRVVYGAQDVRMGACGSWIDLLKHPHPFHKVEVEGGVLATDSAILLKRFFQNIRLENDGDEFMTRGYCHVSNQGIKSKPYQPTDENS